MSKKLFASPGVSARPLGPIDKARELWRDLRWGRRRFWWNKLAWAAYSFRSRHFTKSGRALQGLVKALEAGSYNAASSGLTQGAPLVIEDLAPVMKVVTFDASHVKLQRDWLGSLKNAISAAVGRELVKASKINLEDP